MSDFLTVKQVIFIHDRVITESGGSKGILKPNELDSRVHRPQSGYYKNLFEEAAALMDSLANNHCFNDGNKRTAFSATDIFLRRHGFYLNVDPIQARNVMATGIAHKQFNFDLILEWIFADYERLYGTTNAPAVFARRHYFRRHH
jgi:death on curing protein